MRIDGLIDEDSLSQEHLENISQYLYSESMKEGKINFRKLVNYDKWGGSVDKDRIDLKQLKEALIWVVVYKEFRSGKIQSSQSRCRFESFSQGRYFVSVEKKGKPLNLAWSGYYVFILLDLFSIESFYFSMKDSMGQMVNRAEQWKNVPLERIYLEWVSYENR